MNQTDIIILNFEEIRRRSIKLWNGITPEYYLWKPDEKAMHCLEMIRHVLEAEHLFHVIVNNRGNPGDYQSPWKDRPYTNVQSEIDFANLYRKDFLKAIQRFSETDLHEIEIIRSEKGQRRKLGDYLLRIA